jgi:hypothetical protein
MLEILFLLISSKGFPWPRFMGSQKPGLISSSGCPSLNDYKFIVRSPQHQGFYKYLIALCASANQPFSESCGFWQLKFPFCKVFLPDVCLTDLFKSRSISLYLAQPVGYSCWVGGD